MLTKLMKYDLKSLYKFMVPCYLVTLLVSLLSRGAYYASKSIALLQIPYSFILCLYVVIIICVPIASCVISFIKFYNNLIKDEGYLMNTLPVKKSSLIISKLLSFIIVFITSVLVSVIAIAIGMLGVYFDIHDVTEAISTLIEFIDNTFIVLIILNSFIGVIMQQLMIYLAISFGQRHNKNKGLFSFVYMIAIYYVTQIITSIVILIPMYLNSSWKVYLEQDMPPMKVLNTFILIALLLSVVLSGIYYILTKNNMEKRLNLE